MVVLARIAFCACASVRNGIARVPGLMSSPVRMAIGAREDDIMVQFLMEAIVLALTGGLIGALLGTSVVLGLSLALGWSMRVDPASLGLAMGVSSAIGIVFGFFPARRAARLDPVHALQRE